MIKPRKGYIFERYETFPGYFSILKFKKIPVEHRIPPVQPVLLYALVQFNLRLLNLVHYDQAFFSSKTSYLSLYKEFFHLLHSFPFIPIHSHSFPFIPITKLFVFPKSVYSTDKHDVKNIFIMKIYFYNTPYRVIYLFINYITR